MTDPARKLTAFIREGQIWTAGYKAGRRRRPGDFAYVALTVLLALAAGAGVAWWLR